jgi:hypothetical protein
MHGRGAHLHDNSVRKVSEWCQNGVRMVSEWCEHSVGIVSE